MTPTEQIASLQSQIDELKAQVVLLLQTNTIPRAMEDALVDRLGISSFLTATGTGSPAATSSYSAFPVIVPANPSGTIAVPINGTTYNLLYK